MKTFLTLLLVQAFIVDTSMQLYFPGHTFMSRCSLHVLHVLDESGFAYEQPSGLSSERSDQLSDQHSELTF